MLLNLLLTTGVVNENELTFIVHLKSLENVSFEQISLLRPLEGL